MSSTTPPPPSSRPNVIPPEAFGRGCASCFRSPVSEPDEILAEELATTLFRRNCDPDPRNVPTRVSPGLRAESIVYRTPDTLYPVYLWNNTHYSRVFREGFSARPRLQTSERTYYNLAHHVTNGGVPAERTRRDDNTHIFVSTTISINWCPTPPSAGEQRYVYLYEIYAPGGIWVGPTLQMSERPEIQDPTERRIMEARERYANQEEVAFVLGIAPQYIRTAQRFRLVPGTERPLRVDNSIFYNINFNPEPDNPEFVIQNPLKEYDDDDNCGRQLFDKIMFDPNPRALREKREVSDEDINGTLEWYINKVADVKSYIDGAFRSNGDPRDVYIFMKREYVVINNTPGQPGDKLITGPILIRDGFPSLANTPFGEYGIQCAFGMHNKYEAFIFFGNLCAHIDYSTGPKSGEILKGPMAISSMFPFFKGTVFEKGIDAAFESTVENEAYVFKGDQYALIDYSRPSLFHTNKISNGFRSLKGTIFESGIDAAFASPNEYEAYIFKRDQFTRFTYAQPDHMLNNKVYPILRNFSSLEKVLPRKNQGVFINKRSPTITTTTPSPSIRDEI